MATQFGRSLLMVGSVLAFNLSTYAQSKDSDTFHFSLGAGAEMTDNRDSVADDQAENNTDVFVSPRVEADLFGDTSVIKFHYQPQYRWRNNPSDIQNDSELYHDLGIDLRTKGPVTDLRLVDQFNITDDPAIESSGATLRRDSSFTMNQLELGMNHDLSDRTTLDLEGNSMIKSYDDAQRANESDEDHLGVTATLFHKLSPETAVAGVIDGSSYGYQNSDDYNRDFDTISAGGGLDRVFAPGFRGGVRAGIQSVEYKDGNIDSQSLPFVRVAVTAGQAPALRINTYINVAVADSDVFPFASQEAKELYAKLEYNPGESETTVLGLAATVRTDTLDEDQLPEGGAAYQRSLGFASSGDKETLVLEGSISYSFDAQTVLQLSERMEDVSSDVSVDYTRNSTAVVVTRQF